MHTQQLHVSRPLNFLQLQKSMYMINRYHGHNHRNINPNYPAFVGSHCYILSLFIMQIIELKITIDSLEKESDFYFIKLRDIEILCKYSNISNLHIIDVIQRILYVAEEDASILIYLVFTMLNRILVGKTTKLSPFSFCFLMDVLSDFIVIY
uniref:EB1 C-terminal domain-containing protein n=1 Tax=Lactuca sativa TaxID=4236 RepID=A0A9R1X3L1_LACSA|nr:hypothetical protein LSAT_V11C700380440 [Lactuca sativa]